MSLKKKPLPTLGWNQFALKRHTKGGGGTYSTLSNEAVTQMVLDNWHNRKPGMGETTLDRKVVVPVDPESFVCTTMKITSEMMNAWINPLRAHVTRRQVGEDLYITHSLRRWAMHLQRIKIEPEPALFANVVCYSAKALAESNDQSTELDWEIICLIAGPTRDEPMQPLAMARNELKKPGGTLSHYTALEYAEAVYYWSNRVRI